MRRDDSQNTVSSDCGLFLAVADVQVDRENFSQEFDVFAKRYFFADVRIYYIKL